MEPKMMSEEMEKAFEKWAKTDGEAIRKSEGRKYIHPWCEMGSYNFRPENWIRLEIGFQAAYSLQQEKIDKLNEIVRVQKEALLWLEEVIIGEEAEEVIQKALQQVEEIKEEIGGRDELY